MPHTKETSLPTAEQLDMERRRLRYKRRYNTDAPEHGCDF